MFTVKINNKKEEYNKIGAKSQIMKADRSA